MTVVVSQKKGCSAGEELVLRNGVTFMGTSVFFRKSFCSIREVNVLQKGKKSFVQEENMFFAKNVVFFK